VSGEGVVVFDTAVEVPRMSGGSEREERAKALDRVDVERRHLEGLLKDRINFYLVFASVFMLGLSRIEDSGVRVWALATITLVSFLIGLAVVRTHRLVQRALEEIRRDTGHPYTRYRAAVKFPPNANKILVFIPFILTTFFAAVTTFYFLQR
jgi:hypothetical protein